MSGILKLQDFKSAGLYLTKFQGKKPLKDVAHHLKRTLEPNLVYLQWSVPEKVGTFFINTKLFRNRVGIKHFNLTF